MIGQEDQVLTEQTELLLHQFAYGCYQNGLFEKATRTFQLLTMFRATDFRYWYGLGSALMAWNKESEAIQPFRIASVLAKEDPRPRIYLAECLIHEGKKEEAIIILSEAEELLNNQANASLQKHIQMIKERNLKQEIPI